MNLEQTARVLTKIQLGDNRAADQLILAEWHDTIGDLDFEDTITAVTMHRQESTEYLMPAHLRRNVGRIRTARSDRVTTEIRSTTGPYVPRPRNEVALAAAWNNPEEFARELAIYHSWLAEEGYELEPTSNVTYTG